MPQAPPLAPRVADCPTFADWEDDGDWTAIVNFAMARNFGVSSVDLIAKLDRLLAGSPTDDTIERMLERLDEAEQRVLRDMLQALHRAKLDGLRVERDERSPLHVRATQGDVRITLSLPPPSVTRRGQLAHPNLFSVNIVARR